MSACRSWGGSAACLALLVHAVLGAPVDLNLCIANDGHTEIELAHGGTQCINVAARHHPDQETFAPEDLEHHPCRDLSLRTRAAEPGSAQPRLASPLAVIHFGTTPRAVAERQRPAPRPEVSPPPSDADALRTIVLLV